MERRYDGIVLGTGHNALVLQAYLARAGLRILSIDRAAIPGGGLATVENPRHPGFLHNTHSFFHRGLSAMPWYRDLELERRGARYIEPELNVALIRRDGRTLEWWADPERTVASFAELSPRDAATLRRWIDEFTPIVDEIVLPEACSPPLPPAKRRALLERSARGRRFLEVADLSPLEFVQREFEDDTVRAGLLFFNGLREVDPRLRGFGHSIPSLLASRRLAQMCRGGSAELARALVRDIEAHGGEIACGIASARIVVRNGRAAGVELADGTAVGADAFVASGLNPQQTFLELMRAEDAPGELRERARGFRYNVLAPLFAVDVALEEPPRYSATERRPELERAFMVILGLERFAQFEEIVRAHERGELPPRVAWGACPTLFDPSQAPAGKHTAFLWQKVPFRLGGDAARWEEAREAHGRRLLDFWSEYAPNLAESAVIDASFRSPLDTVRALPNMAAGDLLVGAFDNGQVGFHRPFAGAGTYRTPVPGLYLCGGSTHPGGNITGLCGYNAAAVVAADLGLETWWSPRPVEEAWRWL
jgi:phytoene dehydrogenase-like protein